MKIRLKKLSPDAVLPEYAHGPEEDAGMDLRSVADVVLAPGIPQAVPTGLSIEIPAGYEGQVRPRSGLALKHAILVGNGPGTIDPGYRGEIRVILINAGKADYKIEKGDRIAQLIIARYEPVEWEEGGSNGHRSWGGGVWVFGAMKLLVSGYWFLVRKRSAVNQKLETSNQKLSLKFPRHLTSERPGLPGILIPDLLAIRH